MPERRSRARPSTADMPPVNIEALKGEMMALLDLPRVAAVIAGLSEGQLDVTFRISRRQLVRGPKLTVLLPEVMNGSDLLPDVKD